jgi:Zn-dependent protease
MVWYAAGSLAILLVSVALHELGHLAAAIRVGGGADELVLGPLGGLSPLSVPPDPQCQLVVAIAGPLVNVALALAAAVPLAWSLDGSELLGLMHPFAPRNVLDGPTWLVGFKLTLWINWVLVLANLLLPAPPLDGGRILRSLLWFAVGHRRSVLAVALVAKGTAIALCVAAAWSLGTPSEPAAPPLIPVWIPLVLLGFFLFFSAKAEVHRLRGREQQEEPWSPEAPREYAAVDQAHDDFASRRPSLFQRWLARRKAARQRRQRLLEEEEEWRADDILARVHQFGIDSLSAEDRAILHRVSMRYRNRADT